MHTELQHTQRVELLVKVLKCFFTVLWPDLKKTLIGTEKKLEDLILKAWFEETKTHELVRDKLRNGRLNQAPRPANGPVAMSTIPIIISSQLASNTQRSSPVGAWTGPCLKCFNHELDGHMVQNSPIPQERLSLMKHMGQLRLMRDHRL